LKQFDSADFIKVLARSALHQYHFVSNNQNSTEKQMMKKHMIAFGRLPVFAFVIFALTSGALLAQDNPSAVIRTSMGEIQVELYADKAPLSVENFINYANSGFYNGTIFHRVIGHFMIQGGGFTPDMQKKATGEPIQNVPAGTRTNSIPVCGSVQVGTGSLGRSAHAIKARPVATVTTRPCILIRPSLCARTPVTVSTELPSAHAAY
jgi:hypothetical protein